MPAALAPASPAERVEPGLVRVEMMDHDRVSPTGLPTS